MTYQTRIAGAFSVRCLGQKIEAQCHRSGSIECNRPVAAGCGRAFNNQSVTKISL